MPKERQFSLMLRALMLLAPLMFGSLAAYGAELAVTIKNPDGAPLANAVVTARATSGASPKMPIPANPVHINQHNTTYVPFVTVIPSGGSIDFANSDPWGHHVYSFSKTKRFEVTISGETKSKPVLFDKAGVVVIGCNIHDRMLAYIFVNGEGVSAKSDKTGMVRFPDLKAGEYTLTAWHPLLSSRRDKPTIKVSANDANVTEAEIVLKLKRPKKKKKKRY